MKYLAYVVTIAILVSIPTSHALSGNIIAESATGSEVEIASRFWGNGSPVAHFYKARGSQTTPTSPVAGDLLGGIGSRPWASTGWATHSTAAIHWVASENISATKQGTWINFLTTPTGSDWAARKINMQISPSGYLYYKVGTAQVYKSSAPQTLTNATYSVVSFDSEKWDNRSVYDGINTTRLLAQQDGKYQVSSTVGFAANGNGARIINFRVNGNLSDRYGYQSTISIGSDLITVISSSTTLDLKAGDYVEVYAYQNSGGDLNLLNETNQPGISRFTMQYTGN